MAINKINTRIQLKGDTLENWKKASGFIPLENELLLVTDLGVAMRGDGVTSAKVMADEGRFFQPEGAEYEMVVQAGQGDNSIEQVGTESNAIGHNSVAFGDSTAGCRGYYWKAIDLDNKKIYLSKEQTTPVVVSGGPKVIYDSIELNIEDGDGYRITYTDDGSNTPLTNPRIIDIYGEVVVRSGYDETLGWSYGTAGFSGGVATLEYVGYDSEMWCHTYIAHIESYGDFDVSVYGADATIDSLDYAYGVLIDDVSTTNIIDTYCIPDYAVGDKLAIVNNNKFYPEAYIAAIEPGVITYSGDIGFNQINDDTGDTDLDTYSVYVPTKPAPSLESGAHVIKELAYAEGYKNNAQGTASHAEGRENFAYGDGSHAEGRRTKAAWASHSEGQDTHAEGFYSHTEGRNTHTTVTGESGHAEGRDVTVGGYAGHGEGQNNTVNGQAAHGEGYNNTTSGMAGHSEGVGNTNTGYATHAEGENNNISTNQAHVEGSGNKVNGNAHFAHVEGQGNTVTGKWDHVEGKSSTVSGENAHVEGDSHTVTGSAGHTEGYGNTNKGWASHAEGSGNTIETNQAHVEGNANTLTGDAHYSHAEGKGNNITARQAHAEGLENTVSGAGGHAEGYNQKVSGVHGHAEGDSNTVSADNSHAEGKNNNLAATAVCSHAEGENHTVTSSASHTEGSGNTNKGWAAHVEGQANTVESNQSHAEGANNTLTNTAHFGHVEGRYNTVSGYAAHASGLGNKATAEGQTAIGKYNVIDNDALFIVGKGASDTNRSNAFVVKKTGEVEIAGNVGLIGDIKSNGNITTWDANFGFVSVSHSIDINGKTVATLDDINTNSYITVGASDPSIVGEYTTVEGRNNTATGELSHVEGVDNSTDATHVHIEGRDNIINSGENSSRYTHIEGRWNNVTGGLASHIEGKNNTIEGSTNPVTGEDDEGTWGGSQCHIEGLGNTISGNYTTEAHVEGRYNKVYAEQGHAEGYETQVSAGAKAAHAEGWGTIASGKYAHAEGSKAAGIDDPHGMPIDDVITQATGESSHAEGRGTKAAGEAAHSEGYCTRADGKASHVEGYWTTATGHYAHAEGQLTDALGAKSHAEGELTQARGDAAHSEGMYTDATGEASHAEGAWTKAHERYSHAGGLGTITEIEAQTAVGKYNAKANRKEISNLLYASTYEGAALSVDSSYFRYEYACPGTTADDIGKQLNALSCPIYVDIVYRYIGKQYDADGGIWVETEMSTNALGKVIAVYHSYNAENDDSTLTVHGTHPGLSTFNYVRELDNPYYSITGYVYEGPLFVVGNGSGNSDENRSNAFEVHEDGTVNINGKLIINGITVEPLGNTTF